MTSVFCDQCGEAMPAIASFCGGCGARQEIADARAEVRVVSLGRSAGIAAAPLPRVRRPDELRQPRVDRHDPPPLALARSGAATTRADYPRSTPAPSPPAIGRLHRPPPSMADYPLVPAPLGSRLGATLVDSAVSAAVLALAVTVYLNGRLITPTTLITLGALMLLAPFAFAMLLARPGRHNGQSIGKQVARIRVAPVDGGQVTFGRAVSREVLWKGFMIGFLGGLLVIPSLLNLMWPLFDDGHRALHDKAARTIVVRA
jgi:uncharacterized RDD family membrane protein YckC